MSLIVKPNVGVGSIDFGMTPDEVRNILGVHYKSFKRTPSAAFPCDYFESLGIFVYYKQPGKVEALEFAEPSTPLFENISLLTLSFINLKSLLLKHDKNLEVDEDSLTSFKLGVGAYAPEAAEQPESKIESIIVFEKGYYD
ncbi:hypothetical protein [Zooshikella sp. RANM57]|uniref:hypothetical protein n=1 Tax=Zooshikella sp. RANM57 TaxID=3425863 RepID=UPI003D6E2FE6